MRPFTVGSVTAIEDGTPSVSVISAVAVCPSTVVELNAQVTPAWRDSFYVRLKREGVEVERARYDSASVLVTRLIERQVEEREAEMARLRGEHVEAGWGNQIRSYVLQPYTMVKDLRTGVETSNPTAVLDGDLDAFIEGYLRSRVGEGDPASAV